MLRILFAVLLTAHLAAACQQAPPFNTQGAPLPEQPPARTTPEAFSFNLAEAHLRSDVGRYDTLFPLFDTPQVHRAAPPPATPAAIRKIVLRGSMVGYIENPTPQSQVRIRFDAALNDPTPDRAEFFYAKCGCYGPTPDPNTPGPGFGNPPPDKINFQQLYFTGEYAVGRRFSGIVELPLRWVQPHGPGTAVAFPNSGGVSDLRLGLKYAVLAQERTYMTLQFKSFVPTGDASRGLGTNHASIEPMLLIAHSLSDRLLIEGQFGDTHPLSGSAPVTGGTGKFSGDVMTYGIGPSYRLITHESFSVTPVIELVGWHVFGGYKTGGTPSSDGANIVNIKFGARLGLGQHQSLYAGYGRGLTTAIWYQDIARVEYRYSF